MTEKELIAVTIDNNMNLQRIKKANGAICRTKSLAISLGGWLPNYQVLESILKI